MEPFEVYDKIQEEINHFYASEYALGEDLSSLAGLINLERLNLMMLGQSSVADIEDILAPCFYVLNNTEFFAIRLRELCIHLEALYGYTGAVETYKLALINSLISRQFRTLGFRDQIYIVRPRWHWLRTFLFRKGTNQIKYFFDKYPELWMQPFFNRASKLHAVHQLLLEQ